jgi:carbon-monoxide dehydrogenase large subunit
VDKAFAEADAMVEADFIFGRHTGVTLEPRSVVADWNAAVSAAHDLSGHPGAAHGAEHCGAASWACGVASPRRLQGRRRLLRHQGAYLCRRDGDLCAVKVFARPIKFVADRVESFNTDIHARDHRCKGKIGVKRDGTITAFEIDDLTGSGPIRCIRAPARSRPIRSSTSSVGPYTSKNYRARARVVFQNKNVMCQYRAVGHPIACSVTEGLVVSPP